MRLRLVLSAVSVLAIVAGCASPRVRSGTYYDLPAKDAGSPMPVYHWGDVECSYGVVGYVSADRLAEDDDQGGTDQMLSEMQDRARAMGGDAILIQNADKTHPLYSDSTWTLVGSVVQFQDSTCTH